MSAKAIFVLCAQAFLVQCVLSQCTSRAAVTADPSFIAPAAYGLDIPYEFAGPVLAEPYGFAPCGLDVPYGLAAPDLAAPYGLVDAPYGLEAPCGFGAPILPEPFGLAGLGYSYGLGALDFTPTSGGGLPVTSSSAIPPTGISVISDNAYEGILAVTGELPFVGTVAIEGNVPSVGSGAIHHACGNGVNAMISDITAFAPGYGAPYAPGLAAPALGYGAPYAPGLAAPAPGYGAPWADRGCGYVL